MEKQYIVTEEELKRFDVMSQVISGDLSLKMAHEILGLSYRQVLRIKDRFINEGFEGLQNEENPQALFSFLICRFVKVAQQVSIKVTSCQLPHKRLANFQSILAQLS